MSDFEKLKEMFDIAKIQYRIFLKGEGYKLNPWNIEYVSDVNSLEVGANYFGFVTTFEFNDDGNLKNIGAYE